MAELRTELDQLYSEYHRAELLVLDPLGNIDTSLDAGDFELISFISAGISYGRVEQIRRSLSQLWINLEELGLGKNGKNLKTFLVDKSGKSFSKESKAILKNWVHRFNTGTDIAILLQMLSNLLQDFPSLGAYYASFEAGPPAQRLDNFARGLRSFVPKREQESVRWFTCAPSEGSTCKRMVMWLRWMLRADEIDPGLWALRKVDLDLSPVSQKNRPIDARLAFMPLDTHVQRWARERGLLSRASASWKAVEELTDAFRKIVPNDPARYDFSICHQGMVNHRRSRA